MTTWIVDASVAIAWYLPDEENQHYALQILSVLDDREIYVPSLFLYELTNGIVVAHRRKRIAADALNSAWADITALRLRIDAPAPASTARLASLALRHQLTVYDAAYLDLALRTGFPIATVDKALIQAMEVAGVERVAPSAAPAS